MLDRPNKGAGFAEAMARSGGLGQGARRAGIFIMGLGPSGRRNDPLNVIAMALALVLAAFLGAALGLLWHASGLGGAQAPDAETEREERET